MKEQIFQAIKKYETIIIHRHVRPDPDAYGSQGGLAELIKRSFPEKKVYTVGKEEETLHFLRRLDEIPDSTYEGALVIVTDTANQGRICDQRYSLGEMLIKIDHHPNEDEYGDIIWVDTEASSCSEMIYEFYLQFREEGLILSDEGARLLYAGIVGDTGRFLYPSTTKKTFTYAGELIKYNFSPAELFDKMYEMPENIVKLNGYVLQNFQMNENGMAFMVLDKRLLAEYGSRPADASLLVSTLNHVKGICAWVFFIEEEDQIRVRFRSKGPIINELAKKYNGGGHPLAAGASIYDWNKKDDILKELNELCRNYKK